MSGIWFGPKQILKSPICPSLSPTLKTIIIFWKTIDHCISDILACIHHPLGCVTHVQYVLVLFSSEIRYLQFYSSIVMTQHIFRESGYKACLSHLPSRVLTLNSLVLQMFLFCFLINIPYTFQPLTSNLNPMIVSLKCEK